MHVAPPEDGLDAMGQRQAPVKPQHLADPGVPALDRVVGGVPCATALLPHLHEREQLPAADELVERAPGPSQALVGVEALAVLQGELPQEALPPRAPVAVIGKPCSCGVRVLCVLEPVRDA